MASFLGLVSSCASGHKNCTGQSEIRTSKDNGVKPLFCGGCPSSESVQFASNNFFLSIIKLRQRNNPRDYLTKLWLLDGLEQARSKDEKKAQFLSPLHSSKAYWRKKVVLVA